VTDRLVLWDFDGTLAWRPGMWSGCVLEVLDEVEAGHAVTAERLRRGLRSGFPWHTPHDPHPQICEPGAWWELVEGIVAAALVDAGVADGRARVLAGAVRERYVDGNVGWRLYDDTLAALTSVQETGWRNAILSNHVPELPELVGALGIAPYVDAVFTSALTGFEKPHPEAFRHALRAFGDPQHVWMVGDSPTADVQGAEALGLRAILVRGEAVAEATAVIAAS
jgi:putative hydrolase of the HAD superfamily